VSKSDTQGQLNEIDQIVSRYREQANLEEIKNLGCKVEIYFDTYHVLHMIQGYWELPIDTNHTIELANFNSNRFLIKSLAYFKFIKGIKLLLPHAIELGLQLDKHYLLPSHSVTTKQINIFLQNIKLSSLEELQELSEEKRLQEYLTKAIERSEDIFKANYVLSELNWSSRYNYLMNPKDPVVEFDDTKYNHVQILESNLFHEIILALESMSERQNKSVNNLRDAMALCMFHKKIQQFKEDEHILPLFYVSGGILSNLPQEIKQRFTIRVKKKSINLLKDADFLILDSMFAENVIDVDDEMYKSMKHLKKALNFYSSENTFLDNDLATFMANWNKYRESDFFEKLWSAEKGESKISLDQTIKDLLNYQYIVKNDLAFKKLMDVERESIKNTLTEQLSDLIFLESIWLEVDTFDKELTKRINTNNNLPISEADIFKDEGLTRFSPPVGGDVEKEIVQIWRGFLENYTRNQGRQYQLLKVRLTQLLYDGCLKDDEKDYDKILIGVSILWVFQKYRLIIKVVDKLEFNYGDNYQIGLILVASMIKLEQKTTGSARKMDRVINSIVLKDCFKKNYEAWIGIGYIKFNIWRIYSLHATEINKKYDHYLLESIDLNKKAFLHLEDIKDKSEKYALIRNVKYYYSLNNFIYYSIKGESEVVEQDLFYAYVENLKKCQSIPDYRQPRFSDTIALYYYLRARTVSIKTQKIFFISRALEWVTDAIELSRFKDEIFQEHVDEIKLYQTKL